MKRVVAPPREDSEAALFAVPLGARVPDLDGLERLGREQGGDDLELPDLRRRGLRAALQEAAQQEGSEAWLLWAWLDPGRYQLVLSASSGALELPGPQVPHFRAGLLDLGAELDELDEREPYSAWVIRNDEEEGFDKEEGFEEEEEEPDVTCPRRLAAVDDTTDSTILPPLLWRRGNASAEHVRFAVGYAAGRQVRRIDLELRLPARHVASAEL